MSAFNDFSGNYARQPFQKPPAPPPNLFTWPSVFGSPSSSREASKTAHAASKIASTKLSLKLLVDKKTNKVLFAEAGKDFVDFLFNLLSLPVGTVIGLITNANMVGCIGNLYESVVNLNEAFLQPNRSKNLLLNPPAPGHATNVPLLLHKTQADPTNRKFFSCPYCNGAFMTDQLNTVCLGCRNVISREMIFISGDNSTTNSIIEGGFVKGMVTYMVTDDLSVSPMSMISGVAQLNRLNVQDFGAVEEKVVEFGVDEGQELLKASLQSKAALTAVFLAKKEVKVDSVASNGG